MGIFKSHTTYNRADKISNFTVTTAEYGSAVPEVFGTTRRSGNVIYYDDFTAHEHRESHKAGKGGRKKTVTITYTYTVATILGLCEGPINGIGKVWVGKSVYDYPNDNIGLTCWTGTDTQQPWAYVQGKHPDKALPYKGLAYMAGVVDLGDNATFPTYNFEIKGKLLSTGDYTDANPADVIRYILDKTGLSGVAIDGLDNYRTYCRENDLLISSPMDDTSARETREIINEIINLTNAYMFWSNDHYKIVVLDDQAHGGWKPDTTIRYALTPDDLLPQSGAALVTYSRKDSSEVYNQYPVEFISRKNSYDKETVSYALSKDIAEHGVRQASTTKAHWFYTKERAVKLAEALARKAIYGRNQYTFKLDWAFCRLEVGDLVTLTDPSIGLDKQVVRISSVTEGTNGVLTFTAVSVPPMDVTAPQYDVHSQDRPYVDYNVTAPDTDTPVLIQPPADLTTNGLELWIGAKGKGDLWGGCEVYVADDGTNYRAAGTIASSARVGTLAKSIKATDTSIEVSCNGTFLSGSQQDAERGNTLCWIDGECLSYQGATLLDNGHWRLDGCIRGQHTTTAAAHDAGAQFARLDASLLRIPFLSEDVGKKVYLKFVSFNVFGAGVQDLAAVKAYEYTIKKYYIPAVKNVRAYNRYRHLADGVSRYDVVVQWEPPDLESYAAGQVWYRTNAGQVQDLPAISGVPASELGYYGKWIFGGQGKNEVVIPQAVVGDTYEIAVTTVDKWAASTDPDLAPKVKITVAMRTMVPNTPDGFTLAFSKTATAAWNEVTNTDVMYYEIRRDNAPGAETAGLLARTSGTSATVALNARSGRLYLFARNALGKYSVPAVLDYNKTAPGKPDAPTVKNTMTGFTVAGQGIPADAIGMMVYINDGDAVKTENPVMSYNCEPGIYDVAIAYYDMFGAGERSATTRTVVKIIIDETNIKDMAISLQKVDKTIQDAVKDAQEAIPRLDGVDVKIEGLDSSIAAANKRADDNMASIESKLNAAPDVNGYKSIQDLHKADGELSSTIANNKKDADGKYSTNASLIKQNAGNIQTMVANLNASANGNAYKSISGLYQTAQEISSTVTANKASQDKTNESLSSQITQNADSVTAVIANLNATDPSKSAYKSITQLQANINGVSTTVQNNKTATDTAISNVSQKADNISSTVQTQKTDTDKQISGLSSRITQNASSITSIVTNLGDSTKAKNAYSAIAQMQDDIALRVKSGELVSQINLSKEGVQIDGKLLHVTGDTLFDKNVVVKNMIQAGAVTADKMAVDALSAITANVGSLKGGTITGTQIVGTNFKNSSGSFTVDDSGNIYGATLKSGTIDGNTIRINGYNVRAVTIMRGILWADDDVNNGCVTVPLPAGYTESQCIWNCYTQGWVHRDHNIYYWLQPYQVLSTTNTSGFGYNDTLKKAYGSRTYYCDNSVKDHWVAYWIIGVK